MKICYILPNLEKGGIPRVYEGLSSYFTHQGYRSMTVLLHSGLKLNYRGVGEIYELKEMGNGLFGKIEAFICRLKLLTRLLRKEKPDVIIGFGVAANILMLLSSFSARKICTEHNIKSIENRQWGIYGKMYNILMHFCYKKADCIVALTDAMKDDLQQSYHIPSSKIQVIANPIVREDIVKKAESINTYITQAVKEDDFCLLCLGASEERKGHFQLLTLLPSLLEVNKKIKLVFLGGRGSDTNNMLIYIEENKLSDNVVFVDFDVNPYTWIKRADLMLMPSYYEGFPMSILESLALGTPVIATNCISGPKEILCENEQIKQQTYTIVAYGVLVPSWNEERQDVVKKALYDAIVLLMTNPDKRMLLSAVSEKRSYIYDVELIGKRYESIIIAQD